MCGITGFLTRSAAHADPVATVTAMTRTLSHRGPDSEGIWVDRPAGIALGHRRLAVVDLSPAGEQPMLSSSGRYVIVFNGEIYNFPDLRDQFPGARFHGHSDTEVMLACFERWGVAGSVGRFNGMFAFAVWDRLERTLSLARDPLGEKPLYYGWAGDALIFGSELKALCAHPSGPDTVDRSVLALYLKYGYVPAPSSIYENVFKLPPGSVLTMKADSWHSDISRYWSLTEITRSGCANPFKGSEADAERQLESLLADATKIRMMADVPLGAFLSGGIDSSLIVALMQASSANPVKTFTIGFHEAGYNEAVAAKAVARHLRTDHTEWYVTASEAQAVVPLLPTLYDEPFADSSQIPTFLVSKLARQHVTVSLSGDGGDELFGGYQRYARIARLRRRMDVLPGPVRSAMASVARHAGWLSHKFEKLANVAPLTDPAAFYDANLWHWQNPDEIVIGAGEIQLTYDDWPRCDDFVHRMMAADAVTYLPDDILVKVDRAAMGVSLESRIPMLDPRVVEFAWRLPMSMKQSKSILRRILYKHVPRALVERPKSGFAVPIAQWIRGPLRDWAEELLDEKRLNREGFFEAAPIRRRWAEHLTGKHDHSGALWCVLMVQAWLQNESQCRVSRSEIAQYA